MNLTPAVSGYGMATTTLSSIASSFINAPVVGLTSTGGSWGGGVYTFTVGQNITVAFNNISTGGSDQFHYDLDVQGPNSNGSGPNGFVTAGTAAPNYVIDTSTFLAGNTYTLGIGYDDILSFNGNGYNGAPAGITVAGLYEIRSTITLYAAVPEPSTYAAIFGAVALAGVMLHRRRRQQLA